MTMKLKLTVRRAMVLVVSDSYPAGGPIYIKSHAYLVLMSTADYEYAILNERLLVTLGHFA